jgi:hypothetical protein
MDLRKSLCYLLFFGIVFAHASAYAIPMLTYNESLDGMAYTYEFTLDNDDVSMIDELYVEFSLDDPFSDYMGATSPMEWIYFDGPASDLDARNNYFVAWTADIGAELDLNSTLGGFSISSMSQISGFDFSWNWDRANVASAAPVPEPATMLLLGTGILGLVGASRKKVIKR